MENKTITIALGILLIASVSAMYAGNCEQVDASMFESLDNIKYTVVGNNSNLEGLNISINETNINICPVINYKPDNFTLIFWDDTPKEIIKEVIIHHGGGGTRTVYKNVTEYIEVEKIKYIEKECTECNQTNNETEDTPKITEEKTFFGSVGNFFKSIWNWIGGLFK